MLSILKPIGNFVTHISHACVLSVITSVVLTVVIGQCYISVTWKVTVVVIFFLFDRGGVGDSLLYQRQDVGGYLF